MRKLFLFIVVVIIFKAEAQTSALKIADSLFRLGNYTKAISYYQKETKFTNYNQTKIAESYIGLGANRKAIPYYENVVLKDSALLTARYELGKLYYKTKAITKATVCFEKLIKDAPLNPNFQYYLGLVQLQAKNKSYIQAFKKAVTIDPYHLKSIKQLCKHFLKKKQWLSFEKYSTIGLRNYSEDDVLINYKAQACFNQQQYKKAIHYFIKLHAIDPENTFVLYRLGIANHMLENYKEAIIFYKKAIEQDKTNGDYHSQIGLAYLGLKLYKESYRHFVKAKNYNDVKIDVELYNLGLWYKEQKQYANAIKWFKKALIENPFNYKAQFEWAISADNYYKDIESKLKIYKVYKLSFEGKNKRNDEVVAIRIRHYVELLHLQGDTKQVQE